MNCVISVLVGTLANDGPNGMPRLIWGSTVPRKNQNSSCTRIGVPRNSPT